MNRTCLSKYIVVILTLLVVSCHRNTPKPKAVEIVRIPENLNIKTNENITIAVAYAVENEGKVNDSISLGMFRVLNTWYNSLDSQRTWSNQKQWLPLADSLLRFIRNSENYGLFPLDYHFNPLRLAYERLNTDSSAMMDAALWAQSDLLFTDALFQIIKDLKLGRLSRDSVTLRKDTVLTDSFYVAVLKNIFNTNQMTSGLEALEPRYRGYQELKAALSHFVDTMNRTRFTYLYYPYYDPVDSAAFIRNLKMRLYEGGYLNAKEEELNATALKEVVKNYQKENDLQADGVAGPQVVKSLNNTDLEKFKTIAINLDRYKQLPDSMPQRYIWINIPAFRLYLWDTDTLRLESKIIVGQPQTRTPLLNSTLTNFILFPQWTVPMSIIFKEMLPKIRANVGYLAKENLMVVDKNDSIIDPHQINWFKLNKNYFPYLLKQREGDDNSLGIIKFNFRNKYSVYLHDTNARWLFSKPNRALSHGCIRVQQWNKLSKYLIEDDTLRYRPDTIAAWIKRKEKHVVNFSRKLPIYVRYQTVATEDGRLVFFDDIYAEDQLARKNWFAKRNNLTTL